MRKERQHEAYVTSQLQNAVNERTNNFRKLRQQLQSKWLEEFNAMPAGYEFTTEGHFQVSELSQLNHYQRTGIINWFMLRLVVLDRVESLGLAKNRRNLYKKK